MSRTEKFTFHEDPGHAWLDVPRKLLQELGIAGKISPCSYVSHDGRAYLEEDCDAMTFHEAAEAAGIKLEFEEKLYNGDCFVRHLQPYPAASDWHVGTRWERPPLAG
ncbi:MAG: hypothetical protein V3V08_22070 [Nannocystaceae bacterium]